MAHATRSVSMNFLGSLQKESVFKLLGWQPRPLSSFQLLLDHPLQPNVSIISKQGVVARVPFFSWLLQEMGKNKCSPLFKRYFD